MHAQWVRIERWLARQAPAVLASFNPGATAQTIAATQGALGVAFPAALRTWYAQHDGLRGPDVPSIHAYAFCSLQRMRDSWSDLYSLHQAGEFDGLTSDAQAGIRPVWWTPRWIPLTDDGTGDMACLDLDPAPGGRLGQILWWGHADDERLLLAGSFSDWLAILATQLEQDAYVWTPRLNRLWRRDEL